MSELDFLVEALRNKFIDVVIYLINGVKLTGQLTEMENDYFIIDDKTFIYKHAIASIQKEQK